jgi:hypothetical protein
MNVAPFGDMGQRRLQAHMFPMSSYKIRDAFNTRCGQCQAVMFQCSSCKRKDDADFTAGKTAHLKRQRTMKASAELFDKDLANFETQPPMKLKASGQPSSQAVKTPQPTSQPVKSVKASAQPSSQAVKTSQPTSQPVQSVEAAPPGRSQPPRPSIQPDSDSILSVPAFLPGTPVFLCSTASVDHTVAGFVRDSVDSSDAPYRVYDVALEFGGTRYKVPYQFVYRTLSTAGDVGDGSPKTIIRVGDRCWGFQGFNGMHPSPQGGLVFGQGVCLSIAVDRWRHPCFYLVRLDKSHLIASIHHTDFWFASFYCVPHNASAILQGYCANHAKSYKRVRGARDPPSQIVPMRLQIETFFHHFDEAQFNDPPNPAPSASAQVQNTAPARPAPSAIAAPPPPAQATAPPAPAPEPSSSETGSVSSSSSESESEAESSSDESEAPAAEAPGAAAAAPRSAPAASGTASPAPAPSAAPAASRSGKQRKCKSCQAEFPWVARQMLCDDCRPQSGNDDEDGSSSSASGQDGTRALKRGTKFTPHDKELHPIMYIIASDCPYTHEKNGQKKVWTTALKTCHANGYAKAATKFRQLRTWCNKICAAHYQKQMTSLKASGNAADIPVATILDTVTSDWVDWNLKMGTLSVVNKKHAQIIRDACVTTSQPVAQLANAIATARVKNNAVLRTQQAVTASTGSSARPAAGGGGAGAGGAGGGAHGVSQSPTSKAPAPNRALLASHLTALNEPFNMDQALQLFTAAQAAQAAQAPPGLETFTADLIRLEEATFEEDIRLGTTTQKLGIHALTIMTRLGVSNVAELRHLPDNSEQNLGLPVLAQHRLRGVLAAQRQLS